MTTLEHTVYTIRRGWCSSRTFLFVGAFAAVMLKGGFDDLAESTAHKALQLALFGLWAVIFGLKARRRFNGTLRPSESSRADLELGLLLVVATHAVVEISGGLQSPVYPLVFVLVAFLVVYTPQWVGFVLVGVTIGIELLLSFFGQANAPVVNVVINCIFITFFALINLVFTKTEVARMRRRAKRQIMLERETLVNEARDFRLTAPASSQVGALSREEEELRVSRSAVTEVRRSLYYHVDLLKRTMQLHSCVLLWRDVGKQTLRILECVSDSNCIANQPIDAGDGAPGAVLRRKTPLGMKNIRQGYSGLSYYDGRPRVTDFLGVPVDEAGALRGVLCVDRLDNQPFDDHDKETLLTSVKSILRAMSNERVFTQLQKAKSEQGKVLAASNVLTQALTEKDVVKAALDASAYIATFDIAAMTMIDERGRQQVVEARGSGAEALKGVSFGKHTGLVGSALKTKHFLPYRGEFDPRQQVIFTKKMQRPFLGMQSALVLPLISNDEPLGALVLAAESPSVFGEEVRTTLQVMTNQLATVLLNARMVRKLEMMATTDGLTSLANHRIFQEELDKKLASANRFQKELSIILCDVDKFKGVNDKYGHPVGDTVLVGVAQTLKRNVVRDTDLPARYGGEEFVVLCEGTSTDGAVKLAERIRQDLEKQVFHTDQGELSVTISMGVATFPTHARKKEDLVERADAALYCAKEGGRNQVRVWSKLK